MMLVLPPVELAWETIDLARMRSVTEATVVQVEVVRSSKGDQPIVEYAYRVGGVAYQSKRLLPGFLSNQGRWTGGGRAVKGLAVGQKILIPFNAADPAQACLEYGWFIWAVGFPFFLCGLCVSSGAARLTSLRGRSLAALGYALLFYGFGVVAFNPSAAIRCTDLHRHLLVFLTIFLGAFVWRQWRPRPETAPDEKREPD
jgi:hypothetical protein